MEPRFTLTTVQDQDAYRSTVTINYLLFQKTPTPVLYAAAVAVAAFLWWGTCFSNGRSVSPALMVLSGVVLLGLCLYAVPHLDRFSVKRVSGRILKTTLKNVKDLGTELSFDFFDEDFTLTTPTAQARRSYGDITRLCRTRNHLLLFQGKQFCFSMARSAVPQGLEEFLQERCGRSFMDFNL